MANDYNKVPVKNNMNVEVDNNDEVVATNEKKQLQKVVQVQPTKVKRGLLGRLVQGIVGPEGLPSIGAYINEEIVKPAIKNIIYDSITSGLGRALNMDYRRNIGHGSQNRGPSGYRPRENYSNYSNRYAQRQEPEERRSARPARYGVDDYIIDDRNDAAHVLVTLQEQADRYDVASIADYYDLIGVPTVYTDNDYGWTIDTIGRANIIPARGGGYLIKFPPVEVIK